MNTRAASILALVGALVLAVALLATTRHCEWLALARSADHVCCPADGDSPVAPGGSCCDLVAAGSNPAPLAAPAPDADPGTFVFPSLAAERVALTPPRVQQAGNSPPIGYFVRLACRRITPALAPPLVA